MRRAACSRAYYFAFYRARASAKARGFVEDGGSGKHKQLWDWWRPLTGIEDVAGAGRQLHDWRVDVDYFPTPCSPQNLTDFFELADDLIALIVKVEKVVPESQPT